jgi:hypothetical protein
MKTSYATFTGEGGSHIQNWTANRTLTIGKRYTIIGRKDNILYLLEASYGWSAEMFIIEEQRTLEKPSQGHSPDPPDAL